MPTVRAGALLVAIVLLIGGCRLESDPAQETTAPPGGGTTPGQTFSSPTPAPTEPEGEGEPEETESPDPLDAADVRVSLIEFSFDPAEFAVQPDWAIAFVNDGTVTHNVSLKEEPVGTNLEPGDGTILDASTLTPGSTYGIVCKFHQAQGMQATLHVEE